MVSTESAHHAAWPAYLTLAASGELRRRVSDAEQRQTACDLCPRACGVDRTRTLQGVACRTGSRAVVASFGPHHGEEAPISGWLGSGTIFFAGCNMRCLYCQNWQLSWQGDGEAVDPGELAAIMLSLQGRGCHNINLVSPSHVAAPILQTVEIAAGQGLRLPLVYNTGGYDCMEALRLLDGVVDIYMPDMKYGDSAKARQYSKIRDYVRCNREAVREMHRQVGDLAVDAHGLATRGLLVRHLVLPGGLADTEDVVRFLAEEVSTRTYLNIMDQYRPCHRANTYPELARRPSAAEMRAARDAAHRRGLRRVDDPAAEWRFARYLL